MPMNAEAHPGPRVLHAWGPAARGPEGDAATIDGFDAAPDVVITPSYWGGRRRELFAEELVRRGFDPRIGDVATELMGLERPAVGHSFLVEVEPGRICVSRLDFDSGLADSRLSFRGGDAIEIIRDVAAELLGAAGDAVGDVGGGHAVGIGDAAGIDDVLDRSDAEFIVAADDDRLLSDMRRRGWLAFPVPVELLGARRHGSDGDSGDGRVVDGPPAVEDVPDGLDIAALRRRARDLSRAPRRPRHRLLPVPSLAAAALACVIAAVAIVLIVDGPVGAAWRDETVVAAAAEEPDGAARPAPEAEPAPTDPAAPKAGTKPPVRELAGKGVRVEMPEGWRIDAAAGADALVLVDGGTMRVLVSAGRLPAGTDVDALAAGLAEHAEGTPGMDAVRREVLEGLDVVVHEERPADGSVVLWQHRVVDGWQISVGCQFRGATIPQVRPICGEAVRTAAVDERR
ncbi:hypothetical protein CHAN_02080 [Corynebacterium hansenii]|nr:hypothetical protein CHAN_02080 [Corynebacterium hansenii]